MVTFAETRDPRSLLKATAAHAAATASVAAIGDDLAARVFGGATDPIELPRSPGAGVIPPGQTAPLSMIMLRYPSTGTAKQVASRAAPSAKKAASVRTDPGEADGRRR